MSKHRYEPWLELAMQEEDPLPRWFVVIFLICTIAAFGIAGQLDYESERQLECSQQGLAYDGQADVCIPLPTISNK